MDKVCKYCNICKPITEFPPVGRRCKLCRNKKAHLRGQQINPETGLKSYQTYRQSIRGKITRQKYHKKLREEVLLHYGNGSKICECCGEIEDKFLALDHIVPVGAGKAGKDSQGRPRGQGVGSRPLYRWLRMNNYPPGFRILCHNCNMGRQLNGGICPHQEKKINEIAA